MNGVDRYALFGHPVAHSRSPLIHRLFAQQFGQQVHYEAIDVLPAQFTARVREFFAAGGKGANITVPHKEMAFAMVSELSPRAMLAGAVNTFLPLPAGGVLGDNTDGIGLVRDLRGRLGLPITGQRILLLGAGGAARGALERILELRPACIELTNRSATRLESLRATFAPLAESLGVELSLARSGEFDLIINATSASHSGELPPLPAHVVHAHTLCYDMVYSAGGTTFTHWARELGALRVETGLGMLVEQAAEAFLLWRGKFPDTAPVLAELSR